MFPGGVINVPMASNVDPEYITHLESRLEVELALADAIKNYLCHTTLQCIKSAKVGMSKFTPFVPTMDMLVKKQEELSKLEQQVEDLNELINNPDTPTEMSNLYRVMFIPQLEQQVTIQREWISNIQKQIEDSEKVDNSNV